MLRLIISNLSHFMSDDASAFSYKVVPAQADHSIRERRISPDMFLALLPTTLGQDMLRNSIRLSVGKTVPLMQFAAAASDWLRSEVDGLYVDGLHLHLVSEPVYRFEHDSDLRHFYNQFCLPTTVET